MRGAFLAALFVGVVGVAACSLFSDLDGLSQPIPPDAGQPDSTVIFVEAGTSSDAGADVESGAPPSPCKGTHGPTPVLVNSYCIDSTEVSTKQYREFLVTNPDAGSLPASCNYKTTFQQFNPGVPDDIPVFGVDWCDALAYCKWAGKRLCGGPGGAPASSLIFGTTDDEWFNACSGGGKKIWPYGNDVDAGACTGFGSAGPTAVDAPKSCEGGFPGIFDMSGNLWEWENACDSDAEDANCVVRGGSFASDNSGSCGDSYDLIRSRGTTNDLTIRCCSDLSD